MREPNNFQEQAEAASHDEAEGSSLLKAEVWVLFQV